MATEPAERSRKHRDDGTIPVIDFNEAGYLVRGDEISIILDDTTREAGDPRKGTRRWLRTRIEGARRLRAELDKAIAELEGR